MFRESYNEYDYYQYTYAEDEAGTNNKTSKMCKTVLELPKIGRDESIFTTYSATGGMRIYDSEM